MLRIERERQASRRRNAKKALKYLRYLVRETVECYTDGTLGVDIQINRVALPTHMQEKFSKLLMRTLRYKGITGSIEVRPGKFKIVFD